MLCVSMRKQKHFIWPSESRYNYESLVKTHLFTTQQHNPNVQICATHFMDDSFVNLGQYKAGYAWRLFLKKKVHSDFAMTIWRFWISDCKYVLLLVQVFAIDCSNVDFARNMLCVCVRGTGSHHSGVFSLSEIVLPAACVLQIHTSIITVSV